MIRQRVEHRRLELTEFPLLAVTSKGAFDNKILSIDKLFLIKNMLKTPAMAGYGNEIITVLNYEEYEHYFVVMP
ncbi:hypothetical protein [Candidatus Ichthyocystis hellenicum]|uniref:hypothetical protein n=1 Tax=Candidatus Ichthyocystis hellenicum TaxID=1561003 RepID=UPI00155F084C|nr:hypothetical protein [Candidatus Ichthyocystis hellenicum]